MNGDSNVENRLVLVKRIALQCQTEVDNPLAVLQSWSEGLGTRGTLSETINSRTTFSVQAICFKKKTYVLFVSISFYS